MRLQTREGDDGDDAIRFEFRSGAHAMDAIDALVRRAGRGPGSRDAAFAFLYGHAFNAADGGAALDRLSRAYCDTRDPYAEFAAVADLVRPAVVRGTSTDLMFGADWSTPAYLVRAREAVALPPRARMLRVHFEAGPPLQLPVPGRGRGRGLTRGALVAALQRHVRAHPDAFGRHRGLADVKVTGLIRRRGGSSGAAVGADAGAVDYIVSFDT